MSDSLDIDYDVPAEMPDYRTEPDQHADRRNWHARMAAKLLREKAEQVAAFDRELARLVAERQVLCAEYDARIDWHFAPIEAYHRSLLRDRGDEAPRTITMPYGVSKLTVPKKPQIVFDGDEGKAEALDYVRTHHPDHLKIDVNVSAVRSIGTVNGDRVVDSVTGEIVPGVRPEIPAPTWKLTPTTEETT